MDYMLKLEKAYRNGSPVITDEEWDELVRKTGYKESIGDTVEIFEKSAAGRNLIKMISPLVSLKKTMRKEDIKAFIDKHKDEEFIVEPKLDGLTFNAIYTVTNSGEAILTHLGTSGDGINSLECFKEALYFVKRVGLDRIFSKESVRKFEEKGYVYNNLIEIRGEAIINKKDWICLNKNFPKKKAWRSSISGIFNRKIPSSLRYIISTLDSRKFNILDLKDENTKKLRKYLLNEDILNSIIEIERDRDIINSDNIIVEVRDIDFDTNTRFGDSMKEIYYIDDNNNYIPLSGKIIPSSNKISSLEEIVTFNSFSVSSKNLENVPDTDLIREIPELKTFNLVGIDKIKESINNNSFGDMGITSFELLPSDIDTLINYIGAFFGDESWNKNASTEHRRNSVFMIDGVVIKTKSPDQGLFRTKNLAKFPTNRIAVKLMGKKYRTKILEIKEKTTELGNITVGCTIEPVELYDGTIVRNVNLHNPDWLSRNPWIKENAYVDLVMSADLIPILLEVK